MNVSFVQSVGQSMSACNFMKFKLKLLAIKFKTENKPNNQYSPTIYYISVAFPCHPL